MNGLEAIELMKQGKMITDGKLNYRINEGKIAVLAYGVCDDRNAKKEIWKSVECFNVVKDSYEEYIEPKPLTGWERVNEGQNFYFTGGLMEVNNTVETNFELDKISYENANYFSTEEKAEEINFKQMLFRKLQRFSDENGGNEIDWDAPTPGKYGITYNRYDKVLEVCFYYHHSDFGQVYFSSEEVAEKAIELFHDELIKYFTGDFGGEA